MHKMNNKACSDRRQLFHDIGVIDFVIVEMTEYLDTQIGRASCRERV